jgi:hypothetical protein
MGLLIVPSAHAQAPSPSTSKFFASVNIGAQLASRTLDTSASKTIYEETATLTSSLPIDSGIMPDFGVGYRVYNDIFVGVTFSTFSSTGTATVTSNIPDPLFFNRHKVSTSTQADLKHKEFAVLPQLIYTRALTDKVDFIGGIGPAFIHLSQDVVGSDFTVAAGTQNVTVVSGNESASGAGIHASIGANYNINEQFSVGGLLRFAPAKVTLPSGTKDLNVGGMQVGGGIRINF